MYSAGTKKMLNMMIYEILKNYSDKTSSNPERNNQIFGAGLWYEMHQKNRCCQPGAS